MKRLLLLVFLLTGCAVYSKTIVTSEEVKNFQLTCHGVSPTQCYDMAREKCRGAWYPVDFADLDYSSNPAEETYRLYIKCGAP